MFPASFCLLSYICIILFCALFVNLHNIFCALYIFNIFCALFLFIITIVFVPYIRYDKTIK
nr:MAG TPA: hypothetical protein [Bacteriophage sp.]